MNERNTIIGEVWKKLSSSGDNSRKLWQIIEQRMIETEPFSIGPSYIGSRRASKVKIIDIRFLSLVSAAREMCPQMESSYLVEILPKTLRLVIDHESLSNINCSLYLSLWTTLLDSVLPVSHAGSSKTANLTPSIIMADLIRAFLQRSKYLLASKKAHNLPNSIKMERITTQEVCTGLRSILEAVATENLDAIKAVVDVLLAELSEIPAVNWESDLCRVTILCDTIAIFTKQLKTNEDKEISEQLTKIIQKLISITKSKRTHSTLKLIILNGFGNLYLPPDAFEVHILEKLMTSLVELFINLLDADSDDILLSEALRATKQLLINMEKVPISKYRSKLFSICRQFATRTNHVTRRNALELISTLNQNLDEGEDTTQDVKETFFLVLLSLADQVITKTLLQFQISF